MKLLIECAFINLLLTIFVYIGTKDDKTKLKGFYYYPKEIQERILSIPEFKDYIPKPSAKIISLISSFFMFCIIFFICCILNKATSFYDGFITSVIIGVVMNIYDLLILDLLWFSNSKRTKVRGTEDMIKEYHNPKVHIEAFFRGIIVTFVGAVLVGYIFIK